MTRKKDEIYDMLLRSFYDAGIVLQLHQSAHTPDTLALLLMCLTQNYFFGKGKERGRPEDRISLVLCDRENEFEKWSFEIVIVFW